MGTAPGLPVLEKSAVVMSTAKEPPPQSGETEANGRPEGVSSVAHTPRIGGALPKVASLSAATWAYAVGTRQKQIHGHGVRAGRERAGMRRYRPYTGALPRFYCRISCLPSAVKEPQFYLDVRALLRARVIAGGGTGGHAGAGKDHFERQRCSERRPSKQRWAGRVCTASKSDWWPEHYQSSKFKYGADIMAPPGRP